MTISASELRSRMSYYLDKLENGEEITIVRNSAVIGHLVPSEEIKAVADARRPLVDDFAHLSDNKEVKFRQYGASESPDPIIRLHRQVLGEAGTCVDDPKLDADLLSPGSYYLKWGGEFWVGELDGEIVAMGAFKLPIAADEGGHSGGELRQRQAELKRVRVRPKFQGQGIGTAMLKLLESRAKQQDYRSLILDTFAGTPAQEFYKSRGYIETSRKAAENFELIYFEKEL